MENDGEDSAPDLEADPVTTETQPAVPKRGTKRKETSVEVAEVVKPAEDPELKEHCIETFKVLFQNYETELKSFFLTDFDEYKKDFMTYHAQDLEGTLHNFFQFVSKSHPRDYILPAIPKVAEFIEKKSSDFPELKMKGFKERMTKPEMIKSVDFFCLEHFRFSKGSPLQKLVGNIMEAAVFSMAEEKDVPLREVAEDLSHISSNLFIQPQ